MSIGIQEQKKHKKQQPLKHESECSVRKKDLFLGFYEGTVAFS
jgi:hypothetical protein